MTGMVQTSNAQNVKLTPYTFIVGDTIYKGFNIKQYRFIASELVTKKAILTENKSLLKMIEKMDSASALLDSQLATKDSIIQLQYKSIDLWKDQYSGMESLYTHNKLLYEKQIKTTKRKNRLFKIAAGVVVGGLTYLLVTK